MPPMFVWILSIAIVIGVVIVAIRLFLKKKSNELTKQITAITPFKEIQENKEKKLKQSNESFFLDIETDLRNSFNKHIVSSSEEEQFTKYHKGFFCKVNSLQKSLEAFHIQPSEAISKFARDFGNIHALVKKHNEEIVQNILDTHKVFFDHCLKYPLDKQQRRSIVSEEDNCLVVSSAGSGKTSSIVGKVKYLTEVKGIAPHKILLISYTNKAAAELTERMATNGLKGYTFHKLAIDIIGRATGTKPSICDNTDSLFVDIYHTLLGNKDFKNSIVEYFIDYQSNEADWEQRKNERREKLSEQKKCSVKSNVSRYGWSNHICEK